MKLSHWEMLQNIYEGQIRGGKIVDIQCNKNLLKTCLKQNWVHYIDEDHIEVTELGMKVAEKEFGRLHEKIYGMQGTRMSLD